MKLPSTLLALGFVAVAASVPACTCSSSEAPAPAPQPAAQPAAVSEAPPAGSTSGARSKLQRLDKRKPGASDRLETAHRLLGDGGAPRTRKLIKSKQQMNCGPAPAAATPSP